jgi:predicted site-specific integrase-resolvase
MEHKDRLTRFGLNYIEPWLAMQGRKTERIRAELQNEEGHHPHQARPG